MSGRLKLLSLDYVFVAEDGAPLHPTLLTSPSERASISRRCRALQHRADADTYTSVLTGPSCGHRSGV